MPTNHTSRFLTLATALTALLTAAGCTDLDAPIESEYTPSNFLTTPEQFIAASGPVYSQMRGEVAKAYWNLQELSTDEAVIVARNGNYYDGARYQQLSLHTWNPQNEFVRVAWEWGFSGISTCNRTLALFQNTADGAFKTQFTAELRTMRALYYYMMMDLYGNIPLVPEFGSTEQPANASRQQVFDYIERELKESLPNLSADVSAQTYGRPTQGTAQALLAKLYLNAEVYTGQKKYTEAIAACNAIIKGRKYSLAANYMDVFAVENGPQVNEIIFAVPFDANLAQGNMMSRFALHQQMKDKFGLLFTPSNASLTWPEFFALYKEPNDTRNQQWLSGKQYLADGRTPVLIATTKKGLDSRYTGADGNDKINYHLELSDKLTFRDAPKFDVGNDELGKAQGTRNIKYYPDKSSTSRDQGNDLVLLRYADVLLMKAEALLRGGQDPDAANAKDLVNQIRSRAQVPALTTVDLNSLFEERSREMAWEGWRRTDLIRFGKWESVWGQGMKTNADLYRRIYPIPTTELTLNARLQQNPSY
ncbi:RagB/SusD family nutrient uptake outer membrane protein [Hymenobacter cellulosivorans]|uniref:RagB/SusD family nutrient uptake outer membrane protein n=1 Tax=Hymenobacter cellulosivorans TaxID=2932249 RepID=A0ABY4F8B9_9BACT|nr:RagB/SusD family nutrient uptake outer membrane protein [Hymenobacter cellulosivorans]UOQ52278.1 RagB/SusD family nutrient uptake outer membrane protein [Hymenobacter cellulosivorans]